MSSRKIHRYTERGCRENIHIDDMDYVDDPKIYDEAMSDIDFEKWLEAMSSNIDSMLTNQI